MFYWKIKINSLKYFARFVTLHFELKNSKIKMGNKTWTRKVEDSGCLDMLARKRQPSLHACRMLMVVLDSHQANLCLWPVITVWYRSNFFVLLVPSVLLVLLMCCDSPAHMKQMSPNQNREWRAVHNPRQSIVQPQSGSKVVNQQSLSIDSVPSMNLLM